MSGRFSLLALLAALAGCNAADTPAADAPKGNLTASVSPPADGAAAAPPADGQVTARLDEIDFSENAAAPAPADPAAVDRAWFAGRWTDTGDCADAAHFAPNGTYLLADSTRGMWNIQDSRLVVQHSGGRAVVPLRKIEDDVVETQNGDGSTGRSTRC